MDRAGEPSARKADGQLIHEVIGAPSTPPVWKSTTPPRSWAELAETLQGGLAVLDENWRLTYVSDRFLQSLWNPNELVGVDLRQLVPALADDEPRGLRRQVDRGVRVEFEQQFLDRDDNHHWFRITVLPLPDLASGVGSAVFAKDITPTSRPLAQLRDATRALTEIENELRRRLSREVHDGPVQLLAALMIRLGLLEENETTRDLQNTVSAVTSQMREAVASFTDGGGSLSAASLLRQWISPCLVSSQVDVQIEDHRTTPWELSEVQAAFVFLYQAVRGARFVGGRREIVVTMGDHNDGIRILVTINSRTAEGLEVGRVGAHYRAVLDHARALGGTLSDEHDGAGTRLLSMWIPAGAAPPPSGRLERVVRPDARSQGSADRVAPLTSASLLPPLDDSTWLAIARAAPERLVEHDEQGRFSFTNGVQHHLLGYTSEQLEGESMFSVFSEEAMADLQPTFARLLVGELIDIQWRRNNAFGESRLVRVTTSPRLDRKGRLLGTLSAVDDLSDVHFLEDLYQSALADLGLSRRLVTERTLLQLRPSIEACGDLVRQLQVVEASIPDPAAFRSIRIELDRAIANVRRSVGSLESPDVPFDDLGHAVRRSLESLMAGTEVHFSDHRSATPSPDNRSALFRIAREAVINAVTHGGAGHIRMELGEANDGFTLEIRDDGVGIRPSDLEPKPGHLGTRTMMERARERGGHCRIAPDPRGGTVVSVWLPYQPQRSSLVDTALLIT